MAPLSHGIYSELVKAAGGGDGRVIVHPLAAVHGPVVVAVVVHRAVPVEHQTILTHLFVEGACKYDLLRTTLSFLQKK